MMYSAKRSDLMNARERHVHRMNEIKAEMKTAGVIHRKDLQREYRRMLGELREYDRLQRDKCA